MKYWKLLGLVFLSLVIIHPAFADENEVVALKAQIKDLNDKLAQLQSRVLTVEGRAAAPAGTVAAPSVPAGEPTGLIRTAQDIHMNGYVDTQYNNNFSKHTNNINGNALRSFDNNQNTFSVHQVDLNFSKTPNPEGGAGFDAEILMGDDAAAVESGTTAGANALSAALGTTGAQRFSLLQAYAEFVAPLKFLEGNSILGHTVDIKAGRFVTLAGAEVISATGNWNISRSFLFGLAIPFTHTGVRATYKLFNDKVTTYWGLNNGWDNVIDNNTWKTWETGLSFNPISSVSASSVIYFGPETTRQTGHKRFLWSNVLGWNATDKLSFNSEFDLGTQRRVPGLQGHSFQNAQWWGMAGYARYMLTNKWGLAYRLEFFRDNETFRTGLTKTVWEQTFGTDYKIYDNLTSRLEYRFDKSNGRKPFSGNNSQSTLGAELIYAFA